MYTNSRIETIFIDKIKPEPAPLKQRSQLKNSLINNGQIIQYEEIRVRKIDHPDYEYEYINGRTRGETLRVNGKESIRAIVVENADDVTLHLGAIVANSGKSNAGDEAKHLKYLRDVAKMTIAEIATKTDNKIQWVKARLKLIDDLSPKMFDKLLNGEFGPSTAWELSRLTKRQQNAYSRKNEKITHKGVIEEYRKFQEKNINILFDNLANTQPRENVVLTSEMMNKLVKDDIVEIVWNGEKICIARCE